ncbi:Alg9-like mannosyltransferase family-domain-containing protein [Trametes maxima]|nr:Alg9-like mannosyltransferase family-domain-containing protein [Trametes maxima]
MSDNTTVQPPFTGFKTLYVALVVLRAIFALFGLGYIHPDEYFQNGEVVAGSILGMKALLTWEWDPVFPCRSIVPVWLSTGIPFSVLNLVLKGQPSSPRTIFVAERLSFLLLSFLLDFSVYHLVHGSVRLESLILVASSHVMYTYQLRPFSNSLEAIFVALSLVLLRKLLIAETNRDSSQRSRFYLAALAAIAVSGLFTRITFAAFFLPLAFEVLKWSLRQTRFMLRPLAYLLYLPLLVALGATIGFIYADTRYFLGTTRHSELEITPLNFLRYNLLPSNLAEHGLHPRWLHLVVNLPMIATPGLLYYVLRTEFDIFVSTSRAGDKNKSKSGVVEMMQRTCYWMRWSATSLLSIQPHQEPRFLTPLLVPMVAMAANNARILQWRKPFLMFWVVANAILATLFGMLHQGGVVPSLFRVHDIVYDDAAGLHSHDIRIIYWKTYMPPPHLLALRQQDVDSEKVTLRDLSGASPDSTLDALLSLSSFSKPLSTLLVTPFHAARELQRQIPGCVTERERVFPHLDLDHIGESVQVGWKEGLSLGIFDVDIVCLRGAVSSERLPETAGVSTSAG